MGDRAHSGRSAPGHRAAARVIRADSEEDTALLGRVMGVAALPGDVIALSGPLGAGKTCLAQAVARGMGIVEPVPSPTFNLLLVHGGELPLYHFDLYRLERASQLEDIDFYETLESGGVSVIEWADRFVAELPADRLDVALSPVGEGARDISLSPTGPRSRRFAERIVEAWRHALGETPS